MPFSWLLACIDSLNWAPMFINSLTAAAHNTPSSSTSTTLPRLSMFSAYSLDIQGRSERERAKSSVSDTEKKKKKKLNKKKKDFLIFIPFNCLKKRQCSPHQESDCNYYNYFILLLFLFLFFCILKRLLDLVFVSFGKKMGLKRRLLEML